MLTAVSHITGGLSFCPKDINEGITLFEKEAFNFYNIRKRNSNPIIPGDKKTLFFRLKPEQITDVFLCNAKKFAEFDNEIENIYLENIETHLITPYHTYLIYKYKKYALTNLHNKRIFNEIVLAKEISDTSSIKYNPDIKILLYEASHDRWFVFIKGPKGTPYANKWWKIYITFPESYPILPPVFRFTSIPFHMNVSSDGIVCLNAIGYTQESHIVDCIENIRKLLAQPNVCFYIRTEALDMNKSIILAKESSEQNAKDDYNDYIEGCSISDFTGDEKFYQKILDIDKMPSRKPESKNVTIQDILQGKDRILASSGVYYDKDELRQLVASHKNPIYAITGRLCLCWL